MSLRRYSVDSRPTASATVRRALPLIAGLVAVLALAALSVVFGGRSLADAQQHRLDERARLTRQIASYTFQAYAPDKLRSDVQRAPFSPTNQQVDALLLQQFQVTPTGDPNIVVTLFDRTGRPLATRPQPNQLVVGLLGDAWPRALAGQVAETSIFRLDGQVRRAYAVPVGAGTPWAVLVAVPRDESGQQFQQRLGGLGFPRGGYSALDSEGSVLTSWDPALIGTRLLTPAEVTSLRPANYREWLTGSGSGQRVTIAVRNPVNHSR